MPRREYAVWGYGVAGKRIVSLLQKLDIPVRTVYDAVFERTEQGNGICFREPCRREIAQRRYAILITSLKYEKEIIVELESWGLVRDLDFLTWDELQIRLWISYFTLVTEGHS